MMTAPMTSADRPPAKTGAKTAARTARLVSCPLRFTHTFPPKTNPPSPVVARGDGPAAATYRLLHDGFVTLAENPGAATYWSERRPRSCGVSLRA